MSKVFTITEGLENMGAIKTGGQGSVYKGRRIGEIITAIKILPTPIYSESADDKNYIIFQNEVQKLKKVNEDPNPNVVKILSAGITDSGNFPFIEMEFIEGPDLEELLKPPHEPLFTIKEAVKVADQLACALAHCHKADVRHGDIKSNNVKYNINTGNYILLDFGLAMMSDEERRTSLRHAGAIEFMAPEQNEGKMLFETDVYSFGVIMFELLAGKVPFPLNNQSETGRNAVMIAHLEMQPPDVIQLRSQSIPSFWNDDKKQQELAIPQWLTTMIYKCLEKSPENRFNNGVELHEYIRTNSFGIANKSPLNSDKISSLEDENRRLRSENEQLQQKLLQYKSDGLEKASLSKTMLENTSFVTHSKMAKKRSEKTTRKNLIWIFVSFLLISLAIIYFISTQKTEKATPPEVKQKVAPIIPPAEPPAIQSQLQQAKQFLLEGKQSEAFIIYSSLAKQEIPEAMYYYGKLALQNKNSNISCIEAFDLLKKASDKGYAPAKRTLGFLYSFANDKVELQQAGYADRCLFSQNMSKGSVLLMEATLEGDTTASRLLDVLKTRR